VRDVMLRGAPVQSLVLLGLVVYGLVFAIIGTWLTRHRVFGPGSS
jgi:hypothetical protein